MKICLNFILNGKRDLYFKKHGGVTLDIYNLVQNERETSFKSKREKRVSVFLNRTNKKHQGCPTYGKKEFLVLGWFGKRLKRQTKKERLTIC